jgi:hypothetical protein
MELMKNINGFSHQFGLSVCFNSAKAIMWLLIVSALRAGYKKQLDRSEFYSKLRALARDFKCNRAEAYNSHEL